MYVSAINRQADNYKCIKSKQIHVDRADRQTETDRHIEGQTGRKAKRQQKQRQTVKKSRTDGQTADRITDRRKTNRQTETSTKRQIHRHTDYQKKILYTDQADIFTERETDRHMDGQTDRKANRRPEIRDRQTRQAGQTDRQQTER